MVSEKMQALRFAAEGSEFDTLVFENLYMIGEALGDANPVSEISGESLVLGSMFKACGATNAGKGELKRTVSLLNLSRLNRVPPWRSRGHLLLVPSQTSV